jgi:hypothetical protein
MTEQKIETGLLERLKELKYNYRSDIITALRLKIISGPSLKI